MSPSGKGASECGDSKISECLEIDEIRVVARAGVVQIIPGAKE